jgi:HD-like signal output (HDOD) protein
MGIFSQYDQKACRLFSLEVLAQHSWVTAAMARKVAQLEGMDFKTAEQCFLAGLLHDTGQLVLAFGLPEEYATVIARTGSENLPLWRVEQEFFGATHSDVGAYLLALWGLSNPVIEAVAMHHQPARCPTAEFSPAVAVHVADAFAHEFSKSGEPPPPLDTEYLTQIGCADRIETWHDACRDAIHSDRMTETTTP